MVTVNEGVKKMKCYRIYVDNECVGTYFNLSQAMQAMDTWFGAGYHADRVDLKSEIF